MEEDKDKDVCNIGSTKRKLFEGSSNSNDEKAAKRPRLQVKIPRLQLSEEQLENLRKKSAKRKNEASITSKEDEKKNGATLNTSAAASSTSTAKTVTETATTTTTTTTTATVKEPVTTVEESPVRHRLSNLLDGSSLSPYRGSAAHAEEVEGVVKSISCKGDGPLNSVDSLSGPVSVEDNLFCSEGPLSFDDDCSSLLQEEDCITVPCYPDVISKTCMQVTEADNQTLSGNNSQEAGVNAAFAEDKEEGHEEHQRSQPANDDVVSNLAEEGPVPRSATPSNCDALEQLPNDALPENKEAENGNAEEGSSAMLKSAEVKDEAMDYASHYDTLEVMNTLLTNLTEEKRARTELEEQVSQLEKNNQELVSECAKLRDLVNDLLPLSKVKNETVSRGVQINMDLSLRRGRAVDRATSPLRGVKEPSPDLALLSSSIGCQTVNPPKDVISTSCQTDPVLPLRLPARRLTQSAVPARVQGIVMPNIQERVEAPTNSTKASNPVPTNSTKASNPVQEVAYSRPPPSFLQYGGRPVVARQMNMQSRQGQTLSHMMPKQPASAHHNTQQYSTNMLQAAGYNNATGYQNGTLNAAQVRTSQSSPTGQYAQSPNQFVQISSLLTTQMSGLGSNPSAYSGVHYAGNQRNAINASSLTAQQALQPDMLNQATGQRLNSASLTQLLAQNQLLPQNNLSLSNRTLSSAQSTLYNSRPTQYVGTQQHSNQQQSSPVSTSQVSANARSAVQDKTNAILHYINERRRQIAAAQSLRNSQQLFGTSLPSSMAYNQVASQQHTERLSLQRQVPQSQASQATQLRAQPNPASSRNYQQPLGTFPQSRVANNLVATQQQTQRPPLQHQVSQPDASQAQLHAQPNPVSMQQNNVRNMTRHQSDQSSSSTWTSNSNNDFATKLLENALERRPRSHIEANSLCNEVQLVYNELQKSLNECTSHSKQKQSSTAQATQPLDNRLNQLNTPPNEQPLQAALSSNPVSSISEVQQSQVHRHTPAKQFQLDDTSQVSTRQPAMEIPHSNRSLSVATSERSVHFSQEVKSSEPMDVSSGNENGFSHLGDSDCTDLNSSRQQTSRHISTDKDPYKVPPKTPSGALEETVKRLLALQNKIAATENVPDEGCASSNALAESSGGTSQVANPTESQQSEQVLETSGESIQSNPTEDTSDLDKTQLEDETAPSDNPATCSSSLNNKAQGKNKQGSRSDENDNSVQDIYVDLMSPVIPVKRLLALQNKIAATENVPDEGYASSNALAESSGGTSQVANPTESQQSEQALETSGESIRSNPTEGTSDLDKMQLEDETAPSVLEENKIANENEIEHFPINEGEEQDSVIDDGQKNGVSDGPDTSAACSSSLNNEAQGKDKQGTNSVENDNSVQDIYVDLMSPVIPRMAARRRFRSHSDVHTTEDVGDVDASTSRTNASIQNVDNADLNEDHDPELTQSIDEGEQTFKEGQQESGSLCSKGPSAEAHCNQQGDSTAGSGIAGSEQEDIPFSSEDAVETMQLEEDTQVTLTSATVRAVDDTTKQAAEDVVHDQEHVPLPSEDATEEIQLDEGNEATLTSATDRAVDDAIKQAACNTKPKEMSSTCLGKERLATETSGGHDPPAPVPVSGGHLKLEASNSPCMGEAMLQMDNKVSKKEQYQMCELNPEAIPKQDLVCLNSTFQGAPTVDDFAVTEKPSLKLPLRLEKGPEQYIPSSLVKRNVDGNNVSRILVDSNSNVERNKKDTAANNEPSQQPLNTALLPVPRLALRVVNGNTVIMWDLPPDNNVTEINFFEVCVFLVNKDALSRQNHGGQWIKIGQMKAMPLPMACTIRHLIQKKVVYFFIVRAVGHNGVPGPFSKPCCVACS